MKKLLILALVLSFFGCQPKDTVDYIITNARIYTVDDQFTTAEAVAVKDGRFVAVGTSESVLNAFQSDSIRDMKGQTIVPGFIDAHCHFLGLGYNQQAVDLVGTESFDEVVQRVVAFQKERQLSYIVGQGWDQNDWAIKDFPKKDTLDILFPDTPIALTRIDGHAMLCNQAALDLGQVTTSSKIDGGEVVIENGKLTGVLIDNAENLVYRNWPAPTRQDKVNALMAAQRICTDYGLTTVNDAGLSRGDIEVIDSLHRAGDLDIRVYAMASAYPANLDYYLANGPVKTERLNVRSFKFYADGALGSRGAMLRAPYSDKPGHFGLLVNDIPTLKRVAARIADSDFQMNTHAIGDSANHAVLDVYKNVLKDKPGRRWKIEHAQVISPEDFTKFDDIIPSIQPTHATSDMYWAEDRLGPDRVKGAYAFKQLLNVYGKVALGTDFPVERVNPFYTFYAAVARKDLEQYPEGGYQIEDALSREETLRGMTIWAAYSNFEEEEKGSIEVGKFADFIVLDQDIMSVDIDLVPEMHVLETYIQGKRQ